MLSQIQPEYIIYFFALLFGISSISYFAKDILISLSHTVKNVFMYLISIFFLIISLIIGNTIISIIFIALSLCMYSYSIKYTWNNYNLNKMKKFSLLGLSTVILLIMGLLYQENIIYNINNDILLAISAFMTILFILLLILDIKSENVIYNFEPVGNITIKNDNVKIGEIIIENRGYFSRRINKPNLRLYIDFDTITNEQIPYRIQNNKNSIKPNKTYNIDINANFKPIYEEYWDKKENLEIPDDTKIECNKKENYYEITIKNNHN